MATVVATEEESPAQKKARDDERFRLTASQYLERYNMQIYLQDAVKLVLDVRDEQPLEVLSKYFASLLKGTNVVLREYSYVNATLRNRTAFVQLVLDAHQSFTSVTEFSLLDHLQLVRLLCPDFAKSPYKAAARWISGERLDATCSYAMASAYFQLFFVHSEMMLRIEALFNEMNDSGKTHTITFSRQLIALQEQKPTWCPPAGVLEACVRTAAGGATTLTLRQLITTLVNCPAVVSSAATTGSVSAAASSVQNGDASPDDQG